jgi:hypothetical protein
VGAGGEGGCKGSCSSGFLDAGLCGGIRGLRRRTWGWGLDINSATLLVYSVNILCLFGLERSQHFFSGNAMRLHDIWPKRCCPMMIVSSEFSTGRSAYAFRGRGRPPAASSNSRRKRADEHFAAAAGQFASTSPAVRYGCWFLGCTSHQGPFRRGVFLPPVT